MSPGTTRTRTSPLQAKSATSESRTAAGCASRSRSRTPTSSGCPTWASRRSTGSSTSWTTWCASASSCRRSRSCGAARRRRRRCCTLESQTPVRDFDVVAFSVSFEWDYTNVVYDAAAGRACRAAPTSAHRARSAGRDRRRRDVREPRAARAVRRRDRRRRRRSARSRRCVGAIRAATDRDDLLRRLAAERGFYIPSFYDVALRGRRHASRVRAAARHRRAAGREEGGGEEHRRGSTRRRRAIFTPDTEFGSRFLIEVVRGCANLCRFCWAGYNYLPVRAVPGRSHPGARARRARRTPAASAWSRSRCAITRRSSASSRGLHRDGLLDQPGVAAPRRPDRRRSSACCTQSGERSITIAPETGSDRLRRVINKTVTNDEILDETELIFANGIDNLKLYYMIGLPTETDEDLRGDPRSDAARCARSMLRHARPRGHVGRIVGSVNPLIPKPGTAYQWLPMEDPAITDRKSKRLRTLVADSTTSTSTSSRSGTPTTRRCCRSATGASRPAIEAAERNGGNWRAAVAEAGIDADFYIFRDRSRRRHAALGHHRRRHEDVVLPRRVRQGPARGVDAAAEARSRRTRSSCRCCRRPSCPPPRRRAALPSAARAAPRRAPRTPPESDRESGSARCCRRPAAAARNSAARR